MTIGELIQRVQSLYSKGVPSDDTRLSQRHIYNKLLTVRGKLIFQKVNKNQKVSLWNYQTLPCIELIVAPLHECPCLPPAGCRILKSKNKLPKPLLSLSAHLFENVSSIDGQVIYSETDWEGYKYKKGNKYTAKKPDFFVRDGYIYITHKDGPKIITLTGLFEDPLEALKYPSYCDEEDCTDCVDCEPYWTKEFPIDGDLIDVLIEFTVAELVSVFGQLRQDTDNDGKDNIQEN